ncbi:MAG TPA: S-layer homology domain-containing protein [Candidatus Rifleibacterium sp.]|nr:S-layer homology domain-containing protein [Candidatus Rifleibacterium sp.]
MRKQLLLLVLLLLVLAMPVTAGIFTDVPVGHPALQSIESLANNGILTGIATGTFAGQRRVTRYELAMTVFRTLARLEETITPDSIAVSDTDLNNIDYLKNELSEELQMLGLRVELAQNRKESLRDEVGRLRSLVDKTWQTIKSEEKVRVSGDLLVRHTWKHHRDDHAKNAFSGGGRPGNSNNSLTESQIRLRFDSQVAENVRVVTRFRLFNRGSDSVSAASSERGGAFGISGIGGVTRADMQVDLAFIEIGKIFCDSDRLLFGRSILQTGHGLLLNADIDAVRYERDYAHGSLLSQYIYDRHLGSYRDDAAVDFRGIFNLGYSFKFVSGGGYANFFAQDDPNLLNRRKAGTFNLGNTFGDQHRDRRRDFEVGATFGSGGRRPLTTDLAIALTDYRARLAKPAGSAMVDVDLRGLAGHVALGWQARKALSTKLAYNFADDQFAGAYSLSLDRRYCDNNETPFEDIARGNTWFRNGLKNMENVKLQVEYRPAGRHYYRLATDFLRERRDRVTNALSHHLAGNVDGQIPVGYLTANSPYDTFNNIGIADPALRIITFEYRYQLEKNTRLRVGAVQCRFSGDAFSRAGGSGGVPAGRGFKDDYDYKMLWTEVYSRF